MTKTVFTNDMVAHVWAQQTQEEGRSGNGNFHFRGDTLYSYRTPIARIVDAPNAGKVTLVSSIGYSSTTAGKHINRVGRASNTTHVFRVPTLARCHEGRAETLDHAENLAYLVEQYNKEIARMMRARDLPGDYAREHLERCWRAPFDYAHAFGLEIPHRKSPRSALHEIEEYHATRSTPEAKAKRAKERARREERQRALRAVELGTYQEKRRQWQRGEIDYMPRPDSAFAHMTFPTIMRVKGDTLQTSMGADVPLVHAVKAFRFAKLCRDKGQAWEANGHTIRVGHFTVSKIDSFGNITAGCHFLQWAQIEEAAKAAGVWEAPASDAALEPSRGAA